MAFCGVVAAKKVCVDAESGARSGVIVMRMTLKQIFISGCEELLLTTPVSTSLQESHGKTY